MARPHRPNPTGLILDGESLADYRARRRHAHVKQETQAEGRQRRNREAESRNPGHTIPKSERVSS